MKRCNKIAISFSTSNGYRACEDHKENGMVQLSQDGVAPFMRCDKPIESKRAFFKRMRAYNESGPSHADLSAAESVDPYWDAP